ncbi:unnamed protein product [Clonostachys rosea]|uniref:Uncharacterized protein n=1 Tax=Bionectria ochroleuca TaxID=29856 RepID=A0ABY6UNY6_BIOOC|nr:unnamed protein product [Clonostachys rosea]
METGLPRPVVPIAPMALGPSNELQKVEQARKALQKDQTPSYRASKAITRAIELLNEPKKSGQIHRNYSRNLLLDIYKHFGIDVLLLCIVSLSITKLGDVKRNATQFFHELAAWKMSVEITPELHALATKTLAPVLSEIEAKKAKEHEVPESNPARKDGKGKRKLQAKNKSTLVAKRMKATPSEEPAGRIPGCDTWRVQQPTPDEGSVDANSDDKTECNGPVKEEPQTPQASHPNVTVVCAPQDVPLYKGVWKLESNDVIKAVALQEGNCVGELTIPYDERSTLAFITIRCPISLVHSINLCKERIM